MEQFQKQVGQSVCYKNKRCHDSHETIDHACIGQCQFLSIGSSQGLWRNLTKYQNDQSQNTGTDTYTNTVKNMKCKSGGQ